MTELQDGRGRERGGFTHLTLTEESDGVLNENTSPGRELCAGHWNHQKCWEGPSAGTTPPHMCPVGRPLMWLQSFCPQSHHFLVCICGLEVDRRQGDGARSWVGYHAVFIVAWMGLFPISESVPALGRQFPEGTGAVCSFSASTEKRHSKFFVDT